MNFLDASFYLSAYYRLRELLPFGPVSMRIIQKEPITVPGAARVRSDSDIYLGTNESGIHSKCILIVIDLCRKERAASSE